MFNEKQFDLEKIKSIVHLLAKLGYIDESSVNLDVLSNVIFHYLNISDDSVFDEYSDDNSDYSQPVDKALLEAEEYRKRGETPDWFRLTGGNKL